MPTEAITLFAILGAYLLGSVPFAVIVSRVYGLADPRSYGSGNPGATNVLRSGNRKAAALTLFGDAAKGWLAVFLAQHNGLAEGLVASIALAVFFGHLFPVFLKFKGGKGVATAAGVLLAIHPGLGLAVIGVWLLVATTLRYSSLAALLAALSAPLTAGLLWGGSHTTLAVGAMAFALVLKHWGNLQRLMAGNEPKIGGKKKGQVGK